MHGIVRVQNRLRPHLELERAKAILYLNYAMRAISDLGKQLGPVTENSEIVVQQQLLPPVVHDVGSIASIFSLIVSIYVAFQLKSVASRFRELVLIPKAKTKVRAHLKNLREQLKTKDWVAFKPEAIRVFSLLEHVRDNLNSSLVKKSVKACIIIAEDAKNNESKSFQEKTVEDLINSLTGIEVILENAIEDKKWRSKI